MKTISARNNRGANEKRDHYQETPPNKYFGAKQRVAECFREARTHLEPSALHVIPASGLNIIHADRKAYNLKVLRLGPRTVWKSTERISKNCAGRLSYKFPHSCREHLSQKRWSKGLSHVHADVLGEAPQRGRDWWRTAEPKACARRHGKLMPWQP